MVRWPQSSETFSMPQLSLSLSLSLSLFQVSVYLSFGFEASWTLAWRLKSKRVLKMSALNFAGPIRCSDICEETVRKNII
jgi:hypothetical protein